jgi:hypothetical protein
MDLVASLTRCALTKKEGKPDLPLSNIRLHLFCTFASQDQSIGLDLCEALDLFCKHHNMDTFKLTTRFGNEKPKPRRWDAEFIEQTVTQLKPQKVWVSGTPQMSETFIKSFDSLAQRNIMPASKLCVL